MKETKTIISPTRTFERLRRGTAGIIILVLVLGFMMAIATSNNLLVSTESKGASAGSSQGKSLAAAMSGVQFYLGVLNATDTTLNVVTDADAKMRYHFLASSTLQSGPNQQVATRSAGVVSAIGAATDYPAVSTSAWSFASAPDIVSTDYDCPSSSIFIIKTYVDQDNLASYVYVKSLGCYREIDDDNSIIASYYTQLLARVLINTSTSVISLDHLMQTPVEYPSNQLAPFHKVLPLPWR
ncbi:MAG: hypothetical protein WA705_17365 [Candidatus Ozemobacteraceae bacterium]